MCGPDELQVCYAHFPFFAKLGLNIFEFFSQIAFKIQLNHIE